MRVINIASGKINSVCANSGEEGDDYHCIVRIVNRKYQNFIEAFASVGLVDYERMRCLHQDIRLCTIQFEIS